MTTELHSTIAHDGVRDLAHLERALRHYRAARSKMACARRPIVITDPASGMSLKLDNMKDVRMLLFAAAAAYRGARAEGLTDDAELVLADICQRG